MEPVHVGRYAIGEVLGRGAIGEVRAALDLADGMPVAIKDLLETKDMPTQMGCEAYAGNFPKNDNAAVWALREAGAVVRRGLCWC